MRNLRRGFICEWITPKQCLYYATHIYVTTWGAGVNDMFLCGVHARPYRDAV
jgi:hypothetical protein